MQLPIGFRFRPTDEELLVHYLRRKVMSLPLPASIIAEIHGFDFDPWSLPGDLKEKRYYFCNKKSKFGNKFIMPSSSGFWKTTGKCKQILSSGDKNDDVVGTRKTWRFYQTNNLHSRHWSKTRWIMHEFQLVDSTQNGKCKCEDLVVCRVFQRKVKHNNHGNVKVYCNIENDSQSSFDVNVETYFDLGPPQPSSPSSTVD